MGTWLYQKWMQRCPLPRLGHKMEGYSCPWTALFEDRVLGVDRVSSCCISRVMTMTGHSDVPSLSRCGPTDRVVLVGVHLLVVV